MERKYDIEEIRPYIEQFNSSGKVEFLGSGDHSDVFCINNKYVLKFPKHENANNCLKNEIALLKRLGNIFEIEIPNVIYEGEFTINHNKYTFFASKKLKGNVLTKTEFLALEPDKKEKAARTIANFLKTLHSQDNEKTVKEFVLLHGDFSLNHILFKNGVITGILDFADTHLGNYKKDFEYLLDDEDPEEFGIDFGEKVLKYYFELI
jgi:aminoglycoside 2''-phosphotransferase